jgi:preprotein translocase subunit SecG
MISFLLFSSSFLNFCFYIFAIGFVVALGLEQIVKKGGNARDIYIVETNRKYLWRQSWIVNAFWFLTNLGLYFVARNITPVDNFWSEGL